MRKYVAGLLFIVLLLPLSASAETNPPRSLFYGVSGTDVTELQQFLKDQGLFTYPTLTGFFGHLTEMAVVGFQKAHGVPALGIVGPLTRAAIALSNSKPAAPSSPTNTKPATTSTTTPSVSLPPIYSSNVTVTQGSGGSVVQARHHAAVATGPFSAGAVNFNGTDTYLSTASLTTPAPNGYISFSFWFYAPDMSSNVATQEFFSSDPDNNGYLGFLWKAHTSSSYVYAFNSDYSTYLEGRFVTVPSIGSWHNLIGSMDMSQSPGKVVIYLDGSKITDLDTSNIGGPVGTINIGSQPFVIGADSPGTRLFKGYMADVWIAPGQSLISGSDIPQGTIDKFIDPVTHKPINLGSDGSTPTGTAPSIFLHKASTDAASVFANNNGTGGSFTVTGTLTTAPSNPSD